MELERTLAVLFGPQGPALRSQVEERIVTAGLTIVKASELSGEELEEAGLELGLGTENASRTGDSQDNVHVALILEGPAAVSLFKELAGEGHGALDQNSLKGSFPPLKVFAAPSCSAASMAIATLFPELATADATPNETDTSTAPRRPVPFALSNLAHPNPVNVGSKTLSPTVERALMKLEMEEEERKRYSSGSSTVEPEDEAELRRFQFHSRETTGEIGATSQSDPESLLDEEPISEHAEDQYALYAGPTPTAPPPPARRTSSVSQPRMTKASALRQGITLPPPASRARGASITTSSSLDDAGSTVSGASNSARPAVAPPKSLAAPSIAPRGTKASLLRSNSEDGALPPLPDKPKGPRASLSTAERSALPTFDNVPGYKRSTTVAVASTAAPKVKPRLSRAAMARMGIEAPPSAAMRRQASAEEEPQPAPKVASKPTVRSVAPPSIAPRPTKASALRSGVESPMMARGRSLNTLEDLVEESSATMAAPSMARAHTVHAVQDVGGRPPSQTKRRESLQASVRLTKSAMLRQGMEAPTMARKPSSESGDHTNYEGVPGHKRRESIQVNSTAKPKIEPRMSKGAMLRAGIEVERPAPRRTSAAPADFEGVPGHRRRESIQVASTSRPPTIAPRLNRSTALRTGEVSAPPPRSSSSHLHPPRASSALAPSARASSALSSVSALSGTTEPQKMNGGGGNTAGPKMVRRASSILPRTNKSAELRQAKKDVEATGAVLVMRPSKSSSGSSSSSGRALPSSQGPRMGKRPATAQGIVLGASAVVNGGSSPRNTVFATQGNGMGKQDLDETF